MSAPRISGELHTGLLATLGAGIVSGEYPAGQVLTLDGVSVSHAVSRSVVREVIRVLESLGMVCARRRIGVTVQPSSSWNMTDPRIIRWRLGSGDRAEQLAELGELRRGVEPVAAALAARRADPEQCRVLAAAVSDMAMQHRGGDRGAGLSAVRDFHRTLLAASGNATIRALGEVLAEVPVKPGAARLYDEVARAIRNGDAAAAEHAMRDLLARSDG